MIIRLNYDNSNTEIYFLTSASNVSKFLTRYIWSVKKSVNYYTTDKFDVHLKKSKQ